ncbi:MAG: hypothetical protein ACJ765_01050 [Chloroflexota bacterium]
MDDNLHQNLVDDHISALRHEGERLRAERLAREQRTTQAGPAVAGGRAGDHRPARVRLGRWLIDVGTAVAGTGVERHDGAAGHAA